MPAERKQPAASGRLIPVIRPVLDPSFRDAYAVAIVRSMYADIVAEDLDGHPFGAELARRLRARTTDPAAEVERLGLRQGAFMEELRVRLACLVDDDARARMLIERVALGRP